MSNKSPTEALRIAIEKRILNEFGSKILNEEKLDRVVAARRGSRLSANSEMLFLCECDDEKCIDTISMSTEEYQKVHRKTKYFIVVPSHVHLDLEEIISSFNTYALVGKFFPHPKAIEENPA